MHRQRGTISQEILQRQKKLLLSTNSANRFAIATLFDKTIAGALPKITHLLFAEANAAPMNAHRDTTGPQALRAAATIQPALQLVANVDDDEEKKA